MKKDTRILGESINREGKKIKERLNIHMCPNCREETLIGMPGGWDAICKNCGFKEPCCGD